MKHDRFKYIAFILTTLLFFNISCNDILEISPPSSIIPEDYLKEESQLTSYALSRYNQLPFSGGEIPYDDGTDNAAGMGYSSRFTDGDYKVGERDGNWGFGEIYQINYFLETVLPRYEKGEIEGNKALIEHSIGEMYFLRALQYYYKLTSVGDFPIITKTYTDNFDELMEASKRKPRNEVARFILADLDTAFIMMNETSPDGSKNRLSKSVAKLLSSRVALFEGTWLKYFKDTPFVPNGPQWGGASKEYNKYYKFITGDIDEEIKWFLQKAIEDSHYVASRYELEENTGVIVQNESDINPYLTMFSADDMSKYDEILLWRDFDFGLGIMHNRPVNAGTTNEGVGLSRSFVQSFLMKDGLPYYESELYKGDRHNSKIVENRDDRIRLFLKLGGQQMIWKNIGQGTHGVVVEPMLPNIISGSPMFRYNTGFTSRKYWVGDHARLNNWQGDTSIPIFRASEAYLNYIEAFYELNVTIDNIADGYWKALRQRAGIDTDYNKTIRSTDMEKESQLDWAAYSAGDVLSDAVLFNIRRERRNELQSEGFRFNDLKRWRSMDQLMSKKYHVEGIKLWNSDYIDGYISNDYKFVFDGGASSNVSSPSNSDYLRPYQIMKTNRAYEGYGWSMAHYLEPISIQHFIITSEQGVESDYSDSPIYQNPFWPLHAGQSALK